MLFGFVFLSHQIGSFLGVWLGGRIFDMTQSYDLMWWFSIGLGLLAALLNYPISERPVARLASPATHIARQRLRLSPMTVHTIPQTAEAEPLRMRSPIRC